MWRLMDNEFKVKGLKDTEALFFDKTNIVKVDEDWFAKLTVLGTWEPMVLMEPIQSQDFDEAVERGPCALPDKLRRYFWRGLVPTPQG